MAKFANAAAPPVLPGAEHILSHKHQHRAWALTLGGGLSSCSRGGKGNPRGGTLGHLRKTHGTAATPGKLSLGLLFSCSHLLPPVQHRLANLPVAAQPLAGAGRR